MYCRSKGKVVWLRVGTAPSWTGQGKGPQVMHIVCILGEQRFQSKFNCDTKDAHFPLCIGSAENILKENKAYRKETKQKETLEKQTNNGKEQMLKL